MSEDVSVMFQKGLSEWWSEETEYIFQRIERWAAYARGYNRLRSRRLSRGRMTMQTEQQPRWSVSANKIIIDDTSWSPRFHTLKKSRRRSRPEETKINCCGTFNYQSNNSLDSTCLENYRYDHSIYFKTIGDIKNGKKEVSNTKNQHEDRISISSEELVEWDVNAVSEFIANQLLEDRFSNDNIQNVFNPEGSPTESTNASVSSFNGNLSKLDLGEDFLSETATQDNEIYLTTSENEEEKNNNYERNRKSPINTNLKNQNIRLSPVFVNDNIVDQTEKENNAKGFVDLQRSNRTSRTINHRTIEGDNYVIWPSVLLDYTKNIDPSISPHRYSKPKK